MVAAAISYDGRHRSFRPGASVGTTQTNANGLVLIGSAPLFAMKLKWVRLDVVATTFAPLTMRPPSVSFSTCMYTSLTSSSGLSRSTGGFTIAWLTNDTSSWQRLYHRRAFSSKGV
jgi:hypothetical protein